MDPTKEWISCFGVGSGGTPPAETFNPYIVHPETADLSLKARFTTRNFTNVSGNVSKPRYWDGALKKDFTAQYIEWDKVNDKIYAICVCELDYDELLGKPISEIGFYMATHDMTNNGISTGIS